MKPVLALVNTGPMPHHALGYSHVKPIMRLHPEVDHSRLPLLWPPIVKMQTVPTEISGNCYYYLRDVPTSLVSIDNRSVESYRKDSFSWVGEDGQVYQTLVMPQELIPQFLVDFYARFCPVEALAYTFNGEK